MNEQQRRRLLLWLGIVGGLVLLAAMGCTDVSSGPDASSSPDSSTSSAKSASSGGSIVLQGPGDNESSLITTDDSYYLVRWQATNLLPDPDMPTLPCMFEIVYYQGGGAGARTGGGAFGATTLHTNVSGRRSDSGQGRFRPHPGEGYLSVKACDQAVRRDDAQDAVRDLSCPTRGGAAASAAASFVWERFAQPPVGTAMYLT